MKKIQVKEEKGLAMGWIAGFTISLVGKRINLSLSISINRNVTTKFQIYIKKNRIWGYAMIVSPYTVYHNK